MKTAQTIEQNNAERQTGETPRRDKRGRRINPKSLANLVAPWTAETHPRGGRPKDTAADIARKIFERNQEAIYNAYAEALLAGSPYAFDVIASRAFGKLKQGIIHTGDEDGGPVKASITVEFVKPDGE